MPYYTSCGHGVEALHSAQCLHPRVRRAIYEAAGIITNPTVNLSFREAQQPVPPEVMGMPEPRYGPTMEDPTTTRSLMLVSRGVYSEVSALVYSMNRFSVWYTSEKGLAALCSLSPRSVSLLAELVVHLNGSRRLTRQHACTMPSYGHDRPLGRCARSNQALREWHDAAAHLAAHLTKPSPLAMHFVCDVEDVDTGERAVAPFLRSRSRAAPILATCSIRLGRKRNPALSALARRAAAIATDTEQRAPFRFLDLPRELRLQVLEYTDLVTPHCEVEWARVVPSWAVADEDDDTEQSSSRHGYFFRPRCCDCAGLRQCAPLWRHARRFLHCWPRDCTCLCARYHAAAWSGAPITPSSPACYPSETTLASLCRCWAPPVALFLACRSMRLDAVEVFFKRNRIVVSPGQDCHRALSETPARLPICEYLAGVVAPQPGALAALRFLEVVFPPFGDMHGRGVDFLLEHSAAYRDWEHTIEQVKRRLSLPALTLRVYFADYLPTYDDWSSERIAPNPFRKHTTPDQAKAIFKPYSRIVKPLSSLRGLGRFLVDASWPTSWTDMFANQMRADLPKLLNQTRQLNRACEALVMGRGYDSGFTNLRLVHRHPDEVNDPADSLWVEDYIDTMQYI